ncbi:GNAT family N-acetyltransferase [Nocardiopsis sp. NPDC006198]|uniref:GNAT family N-acetyltransferase n=1 Tax=Nocardiopsis sp. NPDC006198 TaxID=3154472 RepID=UPI0033B5EBFE
MAPANTTGRTGPRTGADAAGRTGDGDGAAGRPGPAGARRPGPPELRLVRLDRGTAESALLRAAVLEHRPLPGRRGYVRAPAATLPLADADPARTPFAVVAGPGPVRDAAGARASCAGFGVLDRAVHARDLVPDPAHAVLLRAFHVAPDWEGKGVGRASCSAPLLDRLAAEVAPDASELVLCVDEANRRAARVYGAAGFSFTGRRLFAEPDGIQLVMVRPLVAGGGS